MDVWEKERSYIRSPTDEARARAPKFPGCVTASSQTSILFDLYLVGSIPTVSVDTEHHGIYLLVHRSTGFVGGKVLLSATGNITPEARKQSTQGSTLAMGDDLLAGGRDSQEQLVVRVYAGKPRSVAIIPRSYSQAYVSNCLNKHAAR